MWSRLAVAVMAGALLAAGAAAGDPGDEKAKIDERVADLQESVSRADARAGVLTSELTEVSGRVRGLEADLGMQQRQLDELDRALIRARTHLHELDTVIEAQTRRLEVLGRQHRRAVTRLEQRVRELYVTDTPDMLSFVLGSSSFTDLLDNLELLGRIGRQDERLVATVAASRARVTDARRRTRSARRSAAATQQLIASRVAAQRDIVARLAANHAQLEAAQGDRRSALAAIRARREDVVGEIAALQEQSAALAAQIRAAQVGAVASAPSSAGQGPLSWPVSGVVTSGFGTRWGRMHEGVDIAVPEGTPVRAAAAGTVIFSGWLGGYGNLVVVDHGGSLSTAYAHNSSLLVAVGQTVASGQELALSGTTGHSTGPHVHFEVRVDGSAVDPLGYL